MVFNKYHTQYIIAENKNKKTEKVDKTHKKGLMHPWHDSRTEMKHDVAPPPKKINKIQKVDQTKHHHVPNFIIHMEQLSPRTPVYCTDGGGGYPTITL